MTQGLSSGPSPFKASIQVRRADTQQVIEQAWTQAVKDVGQYFRFISNFYLDHIVYVNVNKYPY
jgi:hypothetical protein